MNHDPAYLASLSIAEIRALAGGEDVDDSLLDMLRAEPRAGVRSGHMPGSLNLPFPAIVENGQLKSPEAIAAAFDSDEYRARIEAISEAFKKKEENALRNLGQASMA